MIDRSSQLAASVELSPPGLPRFKPIANAGLFMPALLTVVIATGFLVLADSTLTWLILVVLGAGVMAATFLIGDIRRVMLFMFVVTIGIDISKALIIPEGAYTPGLSLFPSDIFLVVLAGAWLFNHCLVIRERLRLDRLHRIALAYLGWLWLAALYADDVLAGVLVAIIYSKFFLAYFIISYYGTEPRIIRTILAGFFVGVMLQAGYVALQMATGSPLEIQGAKLTTVGTHLVYTAEDTYHVFRPAGFLHHPNVLADYLVFVLPTAVMLLMLGKRLVGGRVHIAAGAVFVLGSAMLVVTLARGGWIAGAVALTFAIAVGRKRLVSGRWGAALVGAALTGAVVVALVYPQAYLRITQGDQRSTESRWALIDQALLIIRHNPILGVGLGGYNSAAQFNIPESFSYVSAGFQKELLTSVVHNKYLLVAAEQGVIGLLLLLLLLWRFSALLFPIGAWRDPGVLAIAIGVSAAIIGQAVFYLFDHFYADLRSEMLWVFFGLAHALQRMRHGKDGTGSCAMTSSKPPQSRDAHQ